MFSTLCEQVGLSIKVAKNEEGTTGSFAAVEFETSTMVIQLPPKKLHKARTLVQKATTSQSLSLLEIQQLTGYLNFVSKVVPLGRTFLHRLYNMELYFPPGSKHNRKRISSEAQRDLAWWSKALLHPPERSIAIAAGKSYVHGRTQPVPKASVGFILGKTGSPRTLISIFNPHTTLSCLR